MTNTDDEKFIADLFLNDIDFDDLVNTNPASKIHIGKTPDRDGQPMWLTPKERSMHMHVIGPTGAGKSKFLQWCIQQDIIAGNGVCLLDPKGDLYYDIIAWLTHNRLWDDRKIILLDPSVDGYAFGYNPLNFGGSGPDKEDFASEAFIMAVAQAFMHGAGGSAFMSDTPRLKRLLRTISRTLIGNDLTLAERSLILQKEGSSDIPDYLFSKLSKDLRDEAAFDWALSKRQFDDFIESTRSRLGDFIASDRFRRIYSQQGSYLDFRTIMDEQAVVLVNLGSGEGRCPPDSTRLLGTLLINDLRVQAAQRPQANRTPMYLYVDECHKYLTDDIENILVELRSFGLHCVLAHQNLQQLRDASDIIYQAVMGNARTKVVFGDLDIRDCRDLAENIFYRELAHDQENPLLRSMQVVDHEIITLHGEATSESTTEISGDSVMEMFSSSSFNGIAEGGFFSNMEPVYSSGDQSVGGSASGSFSATAHSTSHSRSSHEALRPVLEERAGGVYSPEEKLTKAAAKIKGTPPRYAIVKTVIYDEIKQIDAQQLYIPNLEPTPYDSETPFLRDVVKEEALKIEGLYTENKMIEQQHDKRMLEVQKKACVPFTVPDDDIVEPVKKRSKVDPIGDYIKQHKKDS